MKSENTSGAPSSPAASVAEIFGAGSVVSGFIKALRKLWYMILIATIVSAGVVYAVSKYRYVPMYRSQASFSVDTSSSALIGNGSLVMDQVKDTLPYVLTSEHMKNLVCDDLGLASFDADVQVSANEYANLFTMTVTAGDAGLCDAVLRSLLDNFPGASVYVMGSVTLQTLDISAVASEPYNGRQCYDNALRGGVFGLLFSVAAAFVYSLYAKTVCDPQDFKKNLNLECIAAVPHIEFKRRRRSFDRHMLIYNEKTGFGFSESFRTMRIRLERACRKTGAKCLFVTSSVAGEGKSTVAANIALSLAENGKKVVLADCDFRNPSVADTLGIDVSESGGIAEVLSGKARLGDTVMHISKWGLDVLPGSEDRLDPAKLLGSSKLAELLRWLKERYDYVIVDTPPAAMLADVLAMAESADGALYVVRQDSARLSQISEGLELLSLGGVRILGAVLNNVKGTPSGSGRYGYGYGYGKYGKYGSKYGYYAAKNEYGDDSAASDDAAKSADSAATDEQ